MAALVVARRRGGYVATRRSREIAVIGLRKIRSAEPQQEPAMRLPALAAAALLAIAPNAQGQTTPPGVTPGAPAGTMLLTVVFRHDQSKPLPDINAELKKNGFYERFPPAGVEVVSW
jgi:hypothetical protein